MNNVDIIKQYIPMVDFISEILGQNCEVVLHDLTDPERSIIAIRNGHLSGRKVGGPLTDLVLKVIKNRSYDEQTFINNYKAVASKREFRSSSFFIKNESKEIIGVLCVNVDIEPFVKVKEVMENFSRTNSPLLKAVDHENGKHPSASEKGIADEKFFGSIEDMLNNMIQEEINIAGVPPERMTFNEKVEIVNKLNEKGTFQLKGAVSKIAKALEVSEPTVYRYLNIGKEDNGK
jgi:predicted transcriptional regulator YheO